jgi:hypothetical protein
MQAALPPDVLQARRETKSSELQALIRSNRNSLDGPPSLKGIGLYTHAAPVLHNLEVRNGTVPEPLPQFVHLQEPEHAHYPSSPTGGLSEEVKMVYGRLKEALEQEWHQDWDVVDPKERFVPIPNPENRVRHEHDDDGDTEMGEIVSEIGHDMMGGAGKTPINPVRRISSSGPGKKRVPHWGYARSMSMSDTTTRLRGSVSTGSTVPDGEDSALLGNVASSNASRYDVERDPRRRRR